MARIEPACTLPIGCGRASATGAERAEAHTVPLLDGSLRQIGRSRGPCACVTGGDPLAASSCEDTGVAAPIRVAG